MNAGNHFKLAYHTAPDSEYQRAVSLDAALELLYAAAIGGAFNEGGHANVAERIVGNIEPLADAIHKARRIDVLSENDAAASSS